MTKSTIGAGRFERQTRALLRAPGARVTSVNWGAQLPGGDLSPRRGQHSSCHWREPVELVASRVLQAPDGAALFIEAKHVSPPRGFKGRIRNRIPPVDTGGKQSVTPSGLDQSPNNSSAHAQVTH